MFMSSMFAGLNDVDPDQERDPPAQPTPVTFPERRPLSNDAWADPASPPKLQPLYSKIVKPSDISDEHLNVLNVQISSDCAPEDLIPISPDGSSYFPPLIPDQAINPASYVDVAKLNAPEAVKRKEFDERLAELRLDNDTGIRVITRTTKPGSVHPRIAYSRKFWEGVESVAQYWDTSVDQYYEVPATTTKDDGEKCAKRQRTDSKPSVFDLQARSSQTDGADPLLTHIPNVDVDEMIAVASSTPLPPECAQQTHVRYKGRRTAAGSDMPDQFREHMVRGFVQCTVHPFGTQTAPPRQMPMVRINKLNVPVRQTAAVYRVPRDRQRARGGFLQGPVLTVQCRPDIDFQADSLSTKQRETKSRLDAIRELGGLLRLAQERQRQGKTEERPGEGQWWTTTPRWGGGSGDEFGLGEQNANHEALVKDALQMAEDMVASASVHQETARRPKRRTPAMLWKELRPGSKVWDAKMEYEAIGKDSDSKYDEIFMVSSLNHHISILKMTVHIAYLEYIRTDTLPYPMPEDNDWCRPKLQRTKWYDLLDVEERVQAFRVLWGISCYLFRHNGDANETAAMQVGTS